MMSEWNAISVLCCACVVLCAIGNSVASPQWQVRYVRWGNITKEEQKRGWTPHWRIEVKHAEPLEIDVIGDDDGTATGRIFIGRTIEVPERLPLEWRIELEYQTACEGKDRSGSWWLYLFTEDGWQLLGERPENAPTEREIERGMLARLLIEDMIGEDVTQWRKWRSPNMASFLQRFSGGRIVLAFCYAGYHSGSREWGKLRNARVVTSDKPIALHRKPQWRLKTKRTLHTDDEIALARKRCRETEGGQRLLQRILRAVERWMKKSDEEIMWLIPNANVPRAFNVSVRGCPIHGKAIYRHGTYPWRLSFDEPFKIICPIGGEKYPDNDFFAFYRSDFRDKRHLQGRFIDDGWGWVSSDGERYWFVGYACHWWWRRFVIPGVLNLSRAYVLTGDRRYAHKAAVMLFRIAQVYPQMDYAWQSRYGQLTGCTYQGKIVNHIWETGVVRNLAEAYDNIFDTIDGDVELQRIAKMNGEQIRAFIEANLIEEAIDGILNRKIVGNFGMHQCALATLVAVRQHAPLEKFVNFILRETGRGISYEGVHYALFNLIYKDGMPYESSPGYCFLWVTKLIPLAELLRRAGYDLYRHPKMKWLLDAPLNMVCINTFTPTIGDYGSVNSKLACANAPVYRAGYRAYRDARYARHLVRIHGWEVERFRSYDDLFEPLLGDIPEDAQKPQKMHSRIMDGYGLTILNNANDTIAISCYYGVRGGHGHFDQLNIELFAHGQKLLPDLGYPDFMNAFVPGIFTWSKNTISHCTVVVDATRQLNNNGGHVEHFDTGAGVHHVDIVAHKPYPQTSLYRRSLVLVEVDDDTAYIVDIFRVRGGKQHDYSLHGPPGKFTMHGAKLTPPQTKGTLAGENVPLGYIYDDPILGAPNYKGGYSGYKGSGFQHLFNVQRVLRGDAWVAEWRHANDEDVGVRIRILPQPNQEIILADARISPIKQPTLLKYLIARRHSNGELQSTFVSVIEPFKDAPFIDAVEQLKVDPDDDAVAVQVKRGEFTDIVLQATRDGTMHHLPNGIATDGHLAVVTFDANGKITHAIFAGGGILRIGRWKLKQKPKVHGRIVAVDPPKCRITVDLERKLSQGEVQSLIGRTAFIRNEWHSCCYTIASIDGDGKRITVTLSGADMRTGLVKVTSINEAERTVHIPNTLVAHAIYRGMRLMTEDYRGGWMVDSISGGVIHLRTISGIKRLLKDANADGVTEAWLVDMGIGDEFIVEPMQSSSL